MVLPNLRACRGIITGSAKYTRAMPTKAQLKAVRDLQHRKERTVQGRFLVQGPKLVAELLGSALHTEVVYATEEAAAEMHLPDAVLLPAHELERIGTLESGNSVVAVARMPLRDPIVGLAEDELVIALDGIGDPGNLGTVLRIADWFGVRRVLCSSHSVDAFGPKCVQASMGAIFRVEVHYAELAARLADLRSSGAALQVASMEGRSVFHASLARPAVLVLGSESHGVSDAVRALGGELISVPRIGGAESLNVAMAAAALCMEYTRQDLG
jgi:TrmH family RNA methyltransferase